MLVHTVLFWLKPELSDAQRATFIAEINSLSAIDCAEAVYIGSPCAEIPNRPVQEVTYDFALTVIFKDVAAHDIYQQHPSHKAFLATCAPLWRQVRIVDAD